jgi:hypothetical protein
MVVMKERMRRLIFLLGLYMFLYMLVKHVMDFQVLLLHGEWDKFVIWSMVMRVWDNMWSQERIYGFLDHLLLGS